MRRSSWILSGVGLAVTAVLAAAGPALLRAHAQDREEPAVPLSGSVPPRELLEYWNADPGGTLYGNAADVTEVRDAAVLRVLESLEHTQEFLGTPVVEAVRDALRVQILEDLHVACWADLYCVPGERELIARCCERALRFKEAALPVLWELTRDTPSWSILQRDRARFGLFVERLIQRTLDGSPDPRGLAAALRAQSLNELADRLTR